MDLNHGLKLGIDTPKITDKNLIEEFLNLMQSNELDFNNSFYYLSFLVGNDKNEIETSSNNQKILSTIQSSDWYIKWKTRLNINKKNSQKILKILLINNPSIVPRNHIVEKVLNDAINENKKDTLNDFLNALNEPYKIRSFDDPYTKPPLSNEEVNQTFCGT